MKQLSSMISWGMPEKYSSKSKTWKYTMINLHAYGRHSYPSLKHATMLLRRPKGESQKCDFFLFDENVAFKEVYHVALSFPWICFSSIDKVDAKGRISNSMLRQKGESWVSHFFQNIIFKKSWVSPFYIEFL